MCGLNQYPARPLRVSEGIEQSLALRGEQDRIERWEREQSERSALRGPKLRGMFDMHVFGTFGHTRKFETWKINQLSVDCLRLCSAD